MDPKTPVAIVVDSAASLPIDIDYESQLHVVPMRLTVGGKIYRDGLDLSPTEFHTVLRKSPTLLSTSAPSPARFLKTFCQAAEDAQSVLCLTVASRFSASFDSAENAAREAEKMLPGVEVVVIDSGSAAGGEGLIALEAWRSARRGNPLSEVLAHVREVIQRVRLLAVVDTLYYLWKSGRVPRITHMGTTLLRIKPLFELKEGQVYTLARPRTRRRAIDGLLELTHQRVGPRRIHASIMHADLPEVAKALQARVEAEFQCDELFVTEFAPVMSAHTGPGLLGIAFWSQ